MQLPGRVMSFDTPLNKLFPTGKDYKGEVGIEIEVEGENLLMNIPSYWGVDKDGSLRGESAEYILLQPCARQSVYKFVKYLEEKLKENKSKVHKSIRTSVHIHLNMSNKTLKECYTLVVLYLIFEDLLINLAGPERVGNLFCLRAKDAEFFIDFLRLMANKRKFVPNQEQIRYTSVNICAITKFNSIEFRALRGTTDPEIINEWVELLLCVKDAAESYNSPADILQEFSALGPDKFIKKVFDKKSKLLTDQFGYEDTVWESARLVQEIVYATNWNEDIKDKRTFFVDDPNRGREWIEIDA